MNLDDADARGSLRDIRTTSWSRTVGDCVLDEAQKELYALHGMPEYEQLLADLRAKAENKLQDDYRQAVNGELAVAAKISLEPWQLDVKTAGGTIDRPFLAPGKPMAVVVSRVHHDGLEKLLPVLKEVWPEFSASLPLGISVHRFPKSHLRKKEEF